jgi:hypothetical protein
MNFRQWVHTVVKPLIEKRVCKLADTWVTDDSYTRSSVRIETPTGFMFWFSFDEMEFKINTKNQRRSLAKERRLNMAETMIDTANEILKIAKRLKR